MCACVYEYPKVFMRAFSFEADLSLASFREEDGGLAARAEHIPYDAVRHPMAAAATAAAAAAVAGLQIQRCTLLQVRRVCLQLESDHKTLRRYTTHHRQHLWGNPQTQCQVVVAAVLVLKLLLLRPLSCLSWCCSCCVRYLGLPSEPAFRLRGSSKGTPAR